MIKVLNVISDTNIGGAGRVILNYLRYSDREGFETSVAVPRGSLLVPELEALDAVVYEVDGIADCSYDRKDVKTLRKLIRKVDPDIVHAHGAFSARIAGRREGKTVIYTRHSAFPVSAKLRLPPGRWVNKFVNEHYADHIIAVSGAAAKNLTDAGISPKRITVMMNGVSPIERISDAETAEYREKWGISEGEFVLGILARIESYKGHLDILEAIASLRSDNKPVRLLIAGAGDFEPEVRKKADELGISDIVSFLGFQSDVAPFLSVLDVQLNASYGTETSSLSILEGFSIGVPAVVSDYGGNPWLVDDGENGLIFKTRDVDDLARCLRRLTDEPETLASMSEKARRVYEERFTGEIFARNVENVYRRTLNEKKRR